MSVEKRIIRLEKRARSRRPALLPPNPEQIAAVRIRLAMMVERSPTITQFQMFENVRDLRALLHDKMREHRHESRH